jgi:hypothetical protein
MVVVPPATAAAEVTAAVQAYPCQGPDTTKPAARIWKPEGWAPVAPVPGIPPIQIMPAPPVQIMAAPPVG